MCQFARIVFSSVFLIQLQILFCRGGPTMYFPSCNFTRGSYNLIQQKNMYDVVFGDEPEPVEIPDKYMERFKTHIHSTVAKLVDDNYDNIDSLLDCFYMYKNHPMKPTTYKDFETAFNEYHPVTSKLGSMKQALNAVSLVRQNFRRTVDDAYIATVWPFIDTATLDNVKQSNTFPLHFHHEAIVPVMRIQYKNETGYIVLDTELGTNQPLIAMDNEAPDPSHKCEIIQNSNEKYILVNNNGYKHLIYVKKCFCSFIQTTAKVRLLKAHRSMIVYESSGKELAKLSFTLHEEPLIFNFDYFDSSTNASRRIPITSLEELMAVPYKSFFEEFVKQMNTDKITLQNTLERLFRMFKHPTFLPFHQQFMEKFNAEQRKRLQKTLGNFLSLKLEHHDFSTSGQNLPNSQEHRVESVFRKIMYPINKRKTVSDSQEKEVHQGYRRQEVLGNQGFQRAYTSSDQLPPQMPIRYDTQHQGRTYQSSGSFSFNSAQPTSTNPIIRPSSHRTTQEAQQQLFLNMQGDRNKRGKGKRRQID